MTNDEKRLWERIKELPGGDQDPFETPVGPTKECLSSNQVVAYVVNNERDTDVVKHLKECTHCNKRIDFMKSYTKTD